MVDYAAKVLADALRTSEEYLQYKSARETAFHNDTTRTLYNEYRKLQVCVQADAAAGRQNVDTLEHLRKVGELLQFDKEAAELLMAEYRLNSMLGRVYKLLAEAVDLDLSMLEA